MTLLRAFGETQTIPRANIADITSSALSLMPEDWEYSLTPQDLADVIAWLLTRISHRRY